MDMIQKVEVLLMSRGMTQGAAEKAVGLATGRISKWKDGQGEPTAVQALRLARLLKVPVEWLIDPETGPEPPLPDADEALVLRVVRALRLDPEEAVRRLTREPSPLDAPAGPAPEPRWVGPQRDLTALELRQQREDAARARRRPAPAPASEDPVGEGERPDPPAAPPGVRRPR